MFEIQGIRLRPLLAASVISLGALQAPLAKADFSHTFALALACAPWLQGEETFEQDTVAARTSAAPGVPAPDCTAFAAWFQTEQPRDGGEQAPRPPVPAPTPVAPPVQQPEPVPAPQPAPGAGEAPDPTPTPVPVAAPAAGSNTQFLTSDTGAGPSRWYWDRHLKLRWKNRMGDYIDANGDAQGTVPFAAAKIEREGWVSVDVTELARQDEGKGFYLKGTSNSGIPRVSGRLSDFPPELIVDGLRVPLMATAGVSESTFRALNTTDYFDLSPAAVGILQFDIPETFENAELQFYVQDKRSSGEGLVELYRLDPPAFTLGGADPVPGRATESDIVKRVDWNDFFLPSRAEVLDSGNTLRHSFIPDTSARDDNRLALKVKDKLMRADLSDPRRPPDVVEEEIHVRMFVLLEDDWTSTRDGNKGGIGWDLRMGWWVDRDTGGYWQSTGGNGGKPGTGLKKLASAESLSSRQERELWEYEGHSIRMEFGKGQTVPHPYNHMRPLESYVYHLDQSGNYGDVVRLGNGVVERGKWFAVEQRIKMNSITGPYDSLGNGTAVADGVLETWLNGDLIHSRTNMRWRRHPEMGIDGVWHNWYYGGKRATETEMHFQVRDVVIARDYIGVD